MSDVAPDGSPVDLTVPTGIGRLAGIAVSDDGDLTVALDDNGRLVLWGAHDKVMPTTWDHPWSDEPIRPGGGGTRCWEPAAPFF